MTAVGFVIAAYGVILGGIALYAGLLLRRLRIARQQLVANGEAQDAASSPVDAPR
jgi:hypothetical protein